MVSTSKNNLTAEIEAFESQYDELAKTYPNKFVIFKDGKFVGAWDTLQKAAEEAYRLFGRDAYLIRQVGVPPISPPVSLMYRSFMGAQHANTAL